MKLGLAALQLGSLAASVVSAKASYDGYRAYRIVTYENVEAIQEQIKSFTTVPINSELSKSVDIAVAPQDVEAFEALDLDVEVIHEDLGMDIAEESEFTTFERMSLIWGVQLFSLTTNLPK